MPPHIIINERVMISSGPEKQERKFRILNPSETIEVVPSIQDTDIPPKKFRMARPSSGGSSGPASVHVESFSAPSMNSLREEDLTGRTTSAASSKPPSNPTSARAPVAANVEPPMSQASEQRPRVAPEPDYSPSPPAPSSPPPKEIVSSLQSPPPQVRPKAKIVPDPPVEQQPQVPRLPQAVQHRVPTSVVPDIESEPFSKPKPTAQRPTGNGKKYHILTMQEKIAMALKNAELQNVTMGDRTVTVDTEDTLPIFHSDVPASVPASQDPNKRYRVIRKSDYLRIFKEQTMRSQLMEDSLLAEHGLYDHGAPREQPPVTIDDVADDRYQRYVEFNRQLTARKAAESAPSPAPTNDPSSRTKHILEMLKMQAHILTQLRHARPSVTGPDDTLSDPVGSHPAPGTGVIDLLTNEELKNKLVERATADMLNRRGGRANQANQSSHLTDNSLRESDIAPVLDSSVPRPLTGQSNVHRFREKPVVDYTPPGSLNTSLIQHSPKQTMTISSEITLPILNRSFLNRIAKEAAARRDFAEQSIRALPELGPLFSKAGMTTDKVVASLSQDLLSEFLLTVSNEMVSQFEELIAEEAGSIEQYAQGRFPYFTRQDVESAHYSMYH
ncbi:hypothetical protein GMRT_23243 [Giardia muris]|uniref:Uncharacterized protein n=1 Tax=Giardia muris TaxID=5742 RepID=A0A4Z1T555_GIAMU|nr:hypothetical protein GMRT_23243 [Giardia muris]|eukprot:TNJ27649.1 hypothetical protein GMRT_23243 [Giardia muris]